jgi:phosphoglycerate kinase
MKSFSTLTDLSQKTVFVRADFNVPIRDGVVADDFRIKKAFTLIDDLRSKGARIILASHIESGEGTLFPVFTHLKERYPVTFVKEHFPTVPQELNEALDRGDIVLLENLRTYSGEKANDASFAKHLAGLADIYINEAFPASHRSHASIVGIPQYIPAYPGPVFEQEVSELSRAFSPEHPFVFILGGAKFETKLPLIQKFSTLADTICMGGALANDFFRAKGFATGKSLLSDHSVSLDTFMTDAFIIPHDVVVENQSGRETKKVEVIEAEDIISDIGPETLRRIEEKIKVAKFVLWNGPLGNYEKGFTEATEVLAKMIAESGAVSLVGGGDTVASIASLGLEEKFTFISTGGGAMLEFLANETLAGIEALNTNT